MALDRRLVVASLSYKTLCQAQHVPRTCSVVAEAVSQVEYFRKMHTQVDPLPAPFPYLPATLS